MKVGDNVFVRPEFGPPPSVAGRVFIVQKINPRNVIARPADGGRGINYPKESLQVLAPGETPPTTRTRLEWFSAGEVVTCTRALGPHAAGEAFVVTKDGGDKVNLSLLGGDGLRYFRVPKAQVQKHDLTWLFGYLASR